MSSNGYYNFEKLKEFDNHRIVAIIRDESADLLAYIAIHRGGLNKPAFGATRLWPYDSGFDALKDALTLSRVMTYKAAMAGLPYGGAKAVIVSPKNGTSRNALLKAYAERVNYLSNHFVTGADVGISPQDVKLMSTTCSNMVGIKCDPVKHTVHGVYSSILACVKEMYGSEKLSERTFAIQGLGKTGFGILELLYSQAKKIYVTDINIQQIKHVLTQFPNIEVVKLGDIYKQKVDVFSPCALSNTLNHKSISKLQCKIIVGSANSQLEDEEIGTLLHKLGILYAPDYIVNAGGLMAVVDEYENGDSKEDQVITKVKRIKNTLKIVIANSKKKNKATNLIANEMAEKIFKNIV